MQRLAVRIRNRGIGAAILTVLVATGVPTVCLGDEPEVSIQVCGIGYRPLCDYEDGKLRVRNTSASLHYRLYISGKLSSVHCPNPQDPSPCSCPINPPQEIDGKLLVAMDQLAPEATADRGCVLPHFGVPARCPATTRSPRARRGHPHRSVRPCWVPSTWCSGVRTARVGTCTATLSWFRTTRAVR